jgi:hypothetical protein
MALAAEGSAGMSADKDTAQAGLSNRRDWKYFDEKLAELRAHDVENIIARGRLLIEAHEELEHGSYEATVKRHMDLGDARRYRIVAAHPIISHRGHGHALPPSMRTLYELTKLPTEMLRAKLMDGTINPKTQRKDVAAWLKGESCKVKLEVDGEMVEPKLSLSEKLKAAEAKIAALEVKLKEAGGGYFDLALDTAEHIGQALADHMSEGRFDTAVKAAKARYKAKRQKPAG